MKADAMTGRIFRTADLERRERGNGIRSLPLASRDTGAEQVLTGMTEIPVGGIIPLHTHSSEEFILVLRGDAIVRVDGREEPVTAMDATLIPSDVEHQFVNVGEEPLHILWVYGDPDTTRTLVESGVTFGHLDPYPTPDE
jgi:quercetin dioxygenase-like cupin family protein